MWASGQPFREPEFSSAPPKRGLLVLKVLLLPGGSGFVSFSFVWFKSVSKVFVFSHRLYSVVWFGFVWFGF